MCIRDSCYAVIKGDAVDGGVFLNGFVNRIFDVFVEEASTGKGVAVTIEL